MMLYWLQAPLGPRWPACTPCCESESVTGVGGSDHVVAAEVSNVWALGPAQIDAPVTPFFPPLLFLPEPGSTELDDLLWFDK